MKQTKKEKRQKKEKLMHNQTWTPTPPRQLGPNPDFPHLCLSGGKVYSKHNEDNFIFFREVPLPMAELSVAWIGPKIPLTVWRQVCAFFELSYEETKGETQARLFFNKKTGEWKAWVFPQYAGTGMSTEEITDHPWRAIQDQELGSGFVAFGTLHHHCDMGAFQSSVDKNNENSQNGLHITIGHLKHPQYDLHGRVVIRGQQYNVTWSEWFESPTNVEHAITSIGQQIEEFKRWEGLFTIPSTWETDPQKLREKFMEWVLCQPPEEEVEIPDQWMKNLIPKSSRHMTLPPQPTMTVRFPNDDNWSTRGNENYNDRTHKPQGRYPWPDALLNQIVEELAALARTAQLSDYRAVRLVEGIHRMRRYGEQSSNISDYMRPHNNEESKFVEAARDLIDKSKFVAVAVYMALEAYFHQQLNDSTTNHYSEAAHDMSSYYGSQE